MTNPNSTPRRLVAVVVTYNRLDKLKVTLARLLDSPEAELAAVVVANNASTDGTSEWLATQTDPRLDIMNSTENTGGAGGFEMGMRRAMEAHNPDWLVVMDDDGRPEPGGLAAFHALPAGKWDAVAAAVYFPSGEICEMNRPSRNPFWHAPEFLRTLFGGGRSGFHIRPSDYEGSGLQIDVTSFVGFFISADAVRKIGYPDPALFIYGDDGIYTLGLTKSGGRIGFEPSVRFEHDLTSFQGKSGVEKTAVQRGRLTPLWKVYYYHRNLLILYRMAAGVLFWPALLAVIPKWLLKARHYGEDRAIFMRLLRAALWDGLLRRPGLSHAEVLRRSK
ncbi:glycosyltransferase [Epibacterium sp. SM1979]|uniref:Glycosyltransferase n=1 Tax=Tritonibacter litoralis TaxID=2662264 RepID=A0A843YK66_9RHOB|nr:glycosyltransferase family 2 protein [Tritonibacter litoralis]MQQ09613.1 glycosyltransferase [Tritonibacter litoralis]